MVGRHRFVLFPLLAVLLVALTTACTEEQVTPAPGTSAGGSGGAAGGGGSGGEEPAKPPGEPQPLAVQQWMVSSVSASKDEIIAAVVDGSFELPAEGAYLGVNWAVHVPGENGALIDANRDYIYAATKITVPEGQRAFARGDTVVAFYTLGGQARHPGDFYHSRKMRVPLAVGAGEHLLVVRALGRRNTPEVELWTTDAEMVINVADSTPPDLVVASSEPRYLGVAVLNMTDQAIGGVSATVLDSEHFEETSVAYPSLSPDATTQLSFLLKPKSAISAPDEKLKLTLKLQGGGLTWTYEQAFEVATVAKGARYRRTRLSAVDGSTQYHAVMPPSVVEDGKKYGLMLSLHGAGVEATGQAAAYSPKDWAYLVAATNRRPFGFDWEEWGRLDALEALDDATATLPIDSQRVHLTGHSMGGHGSWHLGVHFAGKFGLIAPSAGWISFDKYGGSAHPEGAVGRARAASQTLEYVNNLADRSVFIIHGDKDTNVPISHAKQMFQTLQPIVNDLEFHEEPGAGHWWDADGEEEGADCVDWEPMIAKAAGITNDLTPLSFSFKTPSPWVSAQHSFVTVRSCTSPMLDCEVKSAEAAGAVTVTTTNVRSMIVDGAALTAKGVSSLSVDGQVQTLASSPIEIGPQDGKRPELNGPLNQVFHKPFCFVWDDDGAAAYRHYAAWLLSWWSVIGNGHGCGMPLSKLTSTTKDAYNIIYLGVLPSDIGGASLPMSWTAEQVEVGDKTFDQAALAFVYPAGDRLGGFITVAKGYEYLLFRYTPFSSRAGMPDFLVWSDEGLISTGFFDADWKLDAAFAEGL